MILFIWIYRDHIVYQLIKDIDTFLPFLMIAPELHGYSYWNTNMKLLFILRSANQFQTSVKTIRSDNGGDFLNENCRSLFQNLGITHQTSCSFTRQQNERVERKHGQLLNIARVIRIQGSVLNIYRGYYILMTCYLVNLLPSKVLQGKSLHKCLHKKPHSLTHLRIFECICFVIRLKQHI